MPFSRDAFLDLFAVYNNAWWPIAAAFWIATLAVFIVSIVGRDGSEWTFGLMAFEWTWSAVAYHASLFSQINPAAWLFAGLFLIQAGLLMWYGVVERRLRFADGDSRFQFVGYALIAYGLLYPAIALLDGHSYPRVPTFGVPCPTAIVTVGFLVLVRGRIPAVLIVVPLVWAAIGGSAAVLLGVRADLALPVAGVALAVRAWPLRAATLA